MSVYIGFSTTLGRIDLLERFATEAGYSLEAVYGVTLGGDRPYRLEIFAAQATGANASLQR